MKRKLSILQWNCRTITGKVPFLLDYLKSQPQVDVLMLQSLNVRPQSMPRLDGYYYPPVMGLEGDRVMVATYVSKRLTYTNAQTPMAQVGCRLLMCGVSIPTKDNRQTCLVNVYYPEGSSKAEDVAWLQSLDTDGSSWVVAGDFNVSHRLWDAGQTRDTGTHLANTVLDSNLILLNDGSVTRIGTNRQRNSAIDLTMATSDLCLEAEWKTGTDHLQSDHLPLHLVLGGEDPVHAETDQTPRFQYDKANWKLFESTLDVECQLTDPVDPDTNVYLENIRNMILRAAETAIPQKAPGAGGIHCHSSAWWNAECDIATAAKRRALRTFQKDMSEENRVALTEATYHCQTVTDRAQQEHWERFCREEIRGPEDSSKIWKKIKKNRRRTRRPEPSLLVNGQPTRNAQEKAEALADTFSRASQSHHLPEEMRELRREAESEFTKPVMDNSTPLNGDLTIGELRTAIGNLGSASKATGADPISYHMIRRFTESMKKVLLTFYQTCWVSGTVPRAWKAAVVVAIPKEGKPRHLSTSYRPIALTPHLGKVYERLIKNRLEYFLEKNGILPVCQAGFRKGRNCMEHVVRLVEKVKGTLTLPVPRTTVAAFFDIKRAFDTVWHAKLLDKMHSMGISGHLYQFVEAFLDSRQMAVKVGPAVSKTHTLDMGVPQGSVIAPTLFSIMLHDIVKEIGRSGFSISMYADDLAIWADYRAPYTKQFMRSYQECMDDVQTYMQSNGFVLSAEKTVLMVFSTHRRNRQEHTIRIGDQTIRPSKLVKFLGVTISETLTWGTHIANLATKAMRAANLVKLLRGETWATPSSLVHLTGALVRSRLTYGHEAFFTASDSTWNVLERVETTTLKAALGVPKDAINDLVYQEVGWLPLREECRRRCANFEARASTVANTVKEVLGTDFTSKSQARRRLLSSKKNKEREHKRTVPLISLTKEIWEKSKTGPDNVVPSPNTPYPPWELENPQILWVYGEGLSKKADPLYLSTLAKERLSEHFSQHLQIYTDGSVLENGEAGCALVIPDLGISKRFHLNKGVSIFTAELYAILMACTAVNDMPQTLRSVVILSDSKSSLQALAAGGTKNRGEIQSEILFVAHQIICKGTDLTLMWLPSHVGIRGNELADKAAKSATEEGTPANLGLSLAEVVNKARTAVHQDRNKRMKARCEEKGWLFFPVGGKKQRPQLPRRNLQLLRSIRTVSYRSMLLKCNCGSEASLHHAFDGCVALAEALSPLRDYRRTHRLRLQDFLQPHPSLGEQPMRILTEALLASGAGGWFHPQRRPE